MKKDKKNVKAKTNNSIVENDEMRKLILITVVIVLIFGLFYVITKLVTEDNLKQDDILEEVEISFDEIILGDLLNQKEKEYYVLVIFEKDVYASLYNSYFDEYYKKERPLPKYVANINNVFNKNFIAEESKFDMTDLKFKESTLLKVKNNKIVETYEGRKKIVEYLKELIEQ